MSSNVNIIVLEGRLTHDPSLTKTKNGKTLCKFSIANNRYYYSQNSFHDDVSFFRVVSWEKLAEKAGTYLKKGSPVLISGTLKQDSFTAKDGSKRSNVYVLAREVKLLQKRNKAEAYYASDSNLTTKNYKVSEKIEEEESENTIIPDRMKIPF